MPSPRLAVAAAWTLIPLPYVFVGLWTPLARALGIADGTDVPTMVLAVSLAALGALVASARDRRLAYAVAIAGAGLGAFAGSGGGALSSATTFFVATATIGAAITIAHRLASTLPPMQSLAARRWQLALWGVVVLALFLGQSVRIAAFIGDPSFTQGSVLPDDPFLSRHACMTAYVHGSILADLGHNPYDLALMQGDPLTAPLPETAAHFAPFTLDLYGYGPPFLIVPWLMRRFTEDFITLRAVFASVTLVVAVLGLGAMARQIGGTTGRRVWILGPIGLGTPAVLAAISIGNFHLGLVGLIALAWVAFERSRVAWGGGLLAFGIVSKIAPGLLGVVLLVRRQWAAAIATAIAALVLSVVSLPAAGPPVWSDFVTYHLPHLASGEALGFLDDSMSSINFNTAPFGIPFKLAAMGWADVGWAEARSLNTIYTVVLFALAAISAWRGGPPSHRAAAWMALLTLAALRSPYAPPYVMSSAVFVLLLLAGELKSRRSVALFVTIFSLFTLPIPIPPEDGMGISLARQLLALGVLGWVAVRRPHEPDAA